MTERELDEVLEGFLLQGAAEGHLSEEELSGLGHEDFHPDHEIRLFAHLSRCDACREALLVSARPKTPAPDEGSQDHETSVDGAWRKFTERIGGESVVADMQVPKARPTAALSGVPTSHRFGRLGLAAALVVAVLVGLLAGRQLRLSSPERVPGRDLSTGVWVNPEALRLSLSLERDAAPSTLDLARDTPFVNLTVALDGHTPGDLYRVSVRRDDSGSEVLTVENLSPNVFNELRIYASRDRFRRGRHSLLVERERAGQIARLGDAAFLLEVN